MEPIPDDHPDVLEVEKCLSALPDAINQDFGRSFEFYKANQNEPFARRLLVRAVMTYIEGHMAAIRQQLIVQYHFITDEKMMEHVPAAENAAKKLYSRLLAKDYFALMGKSYKDMKRNNLIRDESLCADETIKLLFRLHGQVFEHNITPTEEVDGWQALAEIKKKRNQLTHPSCAADLEVTAEQATRATIVLVWMQGYLNEIRKIETTKWTELYDELLKSEKI